LLGDGTPNLFRSENHLKGGHESGFGAEPFEVRTM
jgi:hypothetical protein